jgi:mannose-1-phosphate guanylyltransferase/mannose-1-phosphate guanylyltransferase/mannose-6-phosphate isomerase
MCWSANRYFGRDGYVGERRMPMIFPVLLTGGSSMRSSPISCENVPGRLQALVGRKTMLEATAQRVADPELFHPLIVAASVEHRFIVGEQLRRAAVRQPIIVLEPMEKQTAPAVATTALIANEIDPDALILVMPADDAVLDKDGFLGAVRAGMPAAQAGALVLFGIEPESAATGYGYIRAGDALVGRARRVEAFVEKPDQTTAEGYLADGRYCWNSGIFLLPTKVVVDELDAHAPQVMTAVRRSLSAAQRDMDFLRLDCEAFAASPPISVDYALMERTDKAAMVPSAFAWRHVGAAPSELSSRPLVVDDVIRFDDDFPR